MEASLRCCFDEFQRKRGIVGVITIVGIGIGIVTVKVNVKA